MGAAAVEAACRHRRRRDLHHAALIVELDGESYAIELAPAWDGDTTSRDVVCTGAVGSRCLGRWRLFRYELRCWRGGSIPDLGRAATAPTPVWGRDERNAGDMWNSNSVIAWLIATGGIAIDAVRPPTGGRAPGWHAGLVVARRRRRLATPATPVLSAS